MDIGFERDIELEDAINVDEYGSPYRWESGEFSEEEQSELLNKLVKFGYMSEEVAEIIFYLNNGDEYENILTDNNLHKTLFASSLEELIINE